MAISLDKLMGFHHKAMQVRTDRMEIIAGNLANANTPGYKARDLDFQKVMKSAQFAREHNLTRTNERHLKGSMQGTGDIQYRVPNQPDTGDGNTVDVQMERNAFLDNGLRYEAGMEFLNGKIKGMKKALSGGQA
ncbi:MAG: flagellar basal body rod protein FlgB [Paraglaciecola sp.]|uniref:flagellar basal body rod protein FlgB n=1 Tax=Pseudomonadati TaxID=3379134 RepID=UPI00273F37F8|nr:flagellar basal body rod protein FlgB [Paraglaciecola sp.]MDP5032930.1 flagellar basal body rod protein FlgB [Paraglaciecola sp.]MDP5040695.1 flagellar basal body rod protein FlgB [Paraglaciecola sp.]MDP5134241.1 flagellar basal body rod protein FlgB [Paraglaciecola sp.]